MSNLANQLVRSERDDVAGGIRLLLASPLITEKTAPENFDLVRRRQAPITQWFEYHCGWRLIVEPRFGYARLAKIHPTTDHTRPARRARSGRAPFDRPGYVLLCVAAAELLTGATTTIGMLADRVRQATAADPLLDTFDTASRAERMAYVDALRFLESSGALDAVDGTTDAFVDSRDAKVLYRVDSTLLVRLLSAPNGPSRIAPEPDAIATDWPGTLTALVRERRYGEGESSTSGWPNTAVMHLLRTFTGRGAEAHYHGDFDGEGLRIAAYVLDNTGARPWRMTTDDYLRGLRPDTPGPAPGRLTDAPWDSGLANTILDRGHSVPEEHVLEDLLHDLQ